MDIVGRVALLLPVGATTPRTPPEGEDFVRVVGFCGNHLRVLRIGEAEAFTVARARVAVPVDSSSASDCDENPEAEVASQVLSRTKVVKLNETRLAAGLEPVPLFLADHIDLLPSTEADSILLRAEHDPTINAVAIGELVDCHFGRRGEATPRTVAYCPHCAVSLVATAAEDRGYRLTSHLASAATTKCLCGITVTLSRSGAEADTDSTCLGVYQATWITAADTDHLSEHTEDKSPKMRAVELMLREVELTAAGRVLPGVKAPVADAMMRLPLVLAACT